MRRVGAGGVVTVMLAGGLIAGAAAGPAAADTQTFDYIDDQGVGVEQTYTVAPGVNVVKIVALGGGGSSIGGGQAGGSGAVVTTHQVVSASPTLIVRVGGGGAADIAGGSATSVTGTGVTVVAGGGGGGFYGPGGTGAAANTAAGGNGSSGVPGEGGVGEGGAGGNAAGTGSGGNGGGTGNGGAEVGGAGGSGAANGGVGNVNYGGGGGGFAGGDGGSAQSGLAAGGSASSFGRALVSGGGGGAGFGGGGGNAGGGGYGGGGGGYGGGGSGGAGGSFASASAPGSAATAFSPGANGAAEGVTVAGDGQVTITALEQPLSVSAAPGIGSATVSWTEGPQPPAAGLVTYTVYANGAPVPGATTSPATVTGLTPGVAYSFTVVASTADGLKTTSATTTATPSAPLVHPKLAQAPARGCVVSGGATLPRKGSKVLMKAHCRTNAGEIVGVRTAKATPKSKGKHTLFCQLTARKTTGTRPASGGTRYCAQGALRVRTFGTRPSLRITWFARGNASFNPYGFGKTYR